VHGGQQLRLFNAHYDEYGFQPIVVFDDDGRFITAVLGPAKRPNGGEALSCAGFCGRSAATGRGRRSCCAPTAIIVVPRSSIGAEKPVSTSFLVSRRPRRCAAISKVSAKLSPSGRWSDEQVFMREL
jgi:hypothetical protein